MNLGAEKNTLQGAHNFKKKGPAQAPPLDSRVERSVVGVSLVILSSEFSIISTSFLYVCVYG